MFSLNGLLQDLYQTWEIRIKIILRDKDNFSAIEHFLHDHIIPVSYNLKRGSIISILIQTILKGTKVINMP